MKKILTSLCFIILFLQSAIGSHIYGTELTYTCNGNDDYTFKLTVYRDCSGFTINPTPFDNPAYFTVFTGDGNIFHTQVNQTYDSVNYNSLNNTTINIQQSNPCIITPNNFCFEATYYELTINLPFNSLGYYVAYERCCRDNSVVNLLNSGINGMIANIFLSKEAQQFCNNSPTFNNYSNLVFCINQPSQVDFSATDIDGDSLAYSLCTANGGSNPFNPQPQNVSSPPPFPNAIYANGFSPIQPISGLISINSSTGIVDVSPSNIGLYAIAVCVDEYKNGVWLSSVKRDIQILNTHCQITVNASVNADSIAPNGDYHLSTCQNDLQLNNTSDQLQFINDYFWEFDMGTQVSTSYLTNPTINFPDTGIYTGKLIINPNDPFCSDTANLIVHVHSKDSLAVDFLHTYDSTLYDPIAFQSLATNSTAPIIKWIWEFGDNYDSELKNPIHYYPDSGTYIVKHTVIDSVGCSKSISKEVEWMPLPILLNNETLYSDTKIKLYPNPVSDILTIEIAKNNFDTNHSIMIYNSVGKKNFEQKKVSKNIIQIPIHQLVNGQYFLKSKYSEGVCILKFTVQK